MEIYIIANVSDRDNVDSFCSQLKNSGMECKTIYPDEDPASRNAAVSSPAAVLWISAHTGEDFFEIARERNAKSLLTVNYFAESSPLYNSARIAIGRNRSVFAELNPEDAVSDVMGLLNANSGSVRKREANTTAARPKAAVVSPAAPAPSPVMESQAAGVSQSVAGSANVALNVDNGIEAIDDNQDTADNNAMSPGKAIVYMLVVFAVFLYIYNAKFEIGSIWLDVISYIPFILSYFCFKILIKLNNWRKLNGFSLKLVLAYVVSIPILIFYLDIVWTLVVHFFQ